MAYYDALIARWATLDSSLSVSARLAAINAASAPGPRRDVPIGQVVGYLALRGKLQVIKAAPAAADFVTLISTPAIQQFTTSDPATYGVIQGTLQAFVSANLLAPEDASGLLGMAETSIPWWRSVGLTSAVNEHDLVAAGLISDEDAVSAGLLEMTIADAAAVEQPQQGAP